MNRTKYYTILFVILLQFTPLYNIGQNTHLEDIKIKEINDSLQVSYRINTNGNPVTNGQAIYLSPILMMKGNHYPLQPVIIAGKNKQQVLRRWANNYKRELSSCIINPELQNDSALYFNVQIPYLQKVDSARMLVKLETLHYRGKHTLTSDMTVSPVIPANQETYTFSPQVSFIIPKKENKLHCVQKSSSVFFKTGHSGILPAYRDNQTGISEMERILRDIVNNKNISLESIYIHGYASPEGRYGVNKTLAMKRALALKNHIRSMFNIPDSLLKTDATPEDWPGLTTLIESKELISNEDIQNIISIARDDEREAALKQLDNGEPYHIIQKELFPRLRRVEYQIRYSIKDYSGDEIKTLEKSNPENLSHLELYNLAMSYGENSTEYNRLLTKTIPFYYPKDTVAINNAAAVSIKNGDLDAARRLLEQAVPSDLLYNNMGIIYMLEGNREEALRCFDKAITSGNEQAVYNKKELQRKK